jgi:hypothetical protein
MAVTASKVMPWMLVDIDCQDRIQRVIESREEKEINGKMMVVTTGHLTASEMFTVVQERTAFEVSSFTAETGNTNSSFSMDTGPNSAISFAKIGRGSVSKYRCTRDNLRMVDKRAAEALETQVWVLETAPVIIKDSQYTEQEEV